LEIPLPYFGTVIKDMSPLGDLRALPYRHYMVVLAVLMATALPGFLTLFLYSRELFVSMDTVKLIFLAISIGAPVFALNYMAAFFMLPSGDKRGSQPQANWSTPPCRRSWSSMAR
jgi:hypothetical protein